MNKKAKAKAKAKAKVKAEAEAEAEARTKAKAETRTKARARERVIVAKARVIVKTRAKTKAKAKSIVAKAEKEAKAIVERAKTIAVIKARAIQRVEESNISATPGLAFPFWVDERFPHFKNSAEAVSEGVNDSRYKLLKLSCDLIKNIPGDIAEFGVHIGLTFRYIIDVTDDSRKYFGFDSFEGMPTSEYSTTYVKGMFAVKNLPVFDSKNVILTKGWFSDTLVGKPSFDKLSFVHIDCDIYESTILALNYCYPFLSNNSIIQFDEIHKVKSNYLLHEYKAWDEFVKEKQIEYEVVGFTEEGQASFCVTNL